MIKRLVKKTDKRYQELQEIFMDVEPYLSYNRIKPIQKINKPFYNYLKKHKFGNECCVYGICEKYITSKEYRPNIVFGDFKIVPYAGVWGLVRKGSDKLISIRNTQKEIRSIIKYLIG